MQENWFPLNLEGNLRQRQTNRRFYTYAKAISTTFDENVSYSSIFIKKSFNVSLSNVEWQIS